MAQHRLVSHLDRGVAVGARVGDQQALVDEMGDEWSGVRRDLLQQCHAALGLLVGALQPQEPWNECRSGELLDRRSVVRQATVRARGCERGLDRATDRSFQAAHPVAIFGQLQHAVRAIVGDQPLQGEGQQRQRVRLVEIGDQLRGQRLLDLDRRLRDPARPLDDFAERRQGQGRQVERQTRDRRERRLRLQRSEAVRADGDDDQQVIVARERIGQRRAHCGTFTLLRREQLLALVDRQDQGGRPCRVGLSAGFGVALKALDHRLAQRREARRHRFRPNGYREPESMSQAGGPGQCGASRPDDGHDQEVLVIAAEPGEQACPQEARLARTRGAEDDQHALRRAVAQAPERVEPLGDLGVAAEEDGGVRLLQRAQAAIGWAVRFARRRPGEVPRVEPGAPQADAQTVQPVLFDLGPRHVGHLEVRGQLDRQLGEGGGRDQDREDALAELGGQQELGDAPARRVPFRRDQHDHRRAALARLLQLLLPALAGGEPMLGVEVEEGVAPALLAQPVADPDRPVVVPAGMADEQYAHGST